MTDPRADERRVEACRRVAMAVLVVALVAVGAVTDAPPAAAATSVVVTPATGLDGGDVVDVQGQGFPPGVVAGWCQGVVDPAPSSVDDCGVNTTYTATVGAGGTFAGQAAVERFLYVPSLARWVDCADPAEGCGIVAAAASDLAGTVTTAPLGFAPPPAPPSTRGTIVVSPDTQVAGGEVTVTGSGFRPNTPIDLFQCAPGATDQSGCGLARVWWVSTDDVGGFAVTTTVGATVDPPGAPPTGCTTADPAPRCLLVAAESVDVPGTFSSAPVDVVPGAVVVTPSTGVVMGPTLATVTGSSFPAGAEVGVCLGVAPTGSLRWWPLTSRDVGQVGFCGTALDFDQSFAVAGVAPDGTFALPGFRLERYVYVYGEDRVVDCAAETCVVHVFDTADVEATLTSVALDVAAPPPPPATRGALTVSPSTGLHGGDVLVVDGTGFRPDALVDLYRCEAGATDRAACERMRTTAGDPASVLADGTGTLPTTLVEMPAGRTFFRFSSPVPDPFDCLAGACSLAAAEAVDFAGTVTEAPLAYAPPAPPRIVPGAVTVVEGDGGTTVAHIPVTLSAASTVEVTARWATIFGPGVQPPAPAVPGVDFTAASGTVRFAPGATSATIDVVVAGDVLDEPDEFVVVSVNRPTNAVMGGYWGLGFGIIDDDDPPAG